MVGAGSIGGRHARNLRTLGVDRLAVHDPDEDRQAALAAELGADAYPSFEQALAARPDVVLVCTPPVHHVAQAREAIAAGAHVFVEKPLGADLAGVDELVALASGRIVQVGYNLHFHPAVRALKDLVETRAVGRILWARAEFGQYLPDWRPMQDYRTSYTARSELGGGILLDASHELAYLVWLLGRPAAVAAIGGHVSDLDVDVEDCVSLVLRFPGGTLADVHVDFVQRTYSRSCKLAGEEGTIELDLAAGTLTVLRPGSEPERLVDGAAIEPTYVAELEHFLDCVARGSAPLVGLDLGRNVLEVVAAAKASISSGTVQEL